MPEEKARPGGGALKRIAGTISDRIKVEKSLDVASRRQQVMLPDVPEVPGYEFASVYRPAEHVSGDFYDIIELGAGRYGLLIGDISGHGMEAGIVMGSARKALQIYARTGEDPEKVLTWGNDDLGRELDRQTFLTAAYSILDTANASLRYVRAGHSHPVLMGPDPGRWQVVKSAGTMIGVTGGERFTKSLEELQMPLAPGQAFIQYTDGLIEARERGGDEFGIDRVIEHLEGEYGAETPLAGMFDGLLNELDSWTGGAEQEDDISILAVRRSA